MRRTRAGLLRALLLLVLRLLLEAVLLTTVFCLRIVVLGEGVRVVDGASVVRCRLCTAGGAGAAAP